MILVSAAVLGARLLTAYIYVCELSVQHVAKHMFTLGVVILSLRVVFQGFVTKQNSEYFAFLVLVFSICLGIACQVFAIIYVPESPYFLYFTHACDDFYDCLARMKRMNDPLAPELDTEELWKVHPSRMKRLSSS